MPYVSCSQILSVVIAFLLCVIQAKTSAIVSLGVQCLLEVPYIAFPNDFSMKYDRCVQSYLVCTFKEVYHNMCIPLNVYGKEPVTLKN